MTIFEIITMPAVREIITRAQEELLQITGIQLHVELRQKQASYIKKTTAYSAADDIIDAFCDVWEIKREELLKKSRKASLVAMRQILALRLRMTGLHYSTIGRKMGGMDHTTIIYHQNAAKNLIACNDPFFLAYLLPVSHLFPVHIQNATA